MTALDSGARSSARTAPIAGVADLTVARPSAWGLAVGPRATPALERRLTWERAYRVRLAVTDTVIVLATACLASVLQLSALAPAAFTEDPWVLTRLPLATAADRKSPRLKSRH